MTVFALASYCYICDEAAPDMNKARVGAVREDNVVAEDYKLSGLVQPSAGCGREIPGLYEGLNGGEGAGLLELSYYEGNDGHLHC